VALGWLRVSHRELDTERSTPQQPWLTHREEQLLNTGEHVPVDIQIWPFGTIFHAGETLRLVIQGSDVNVYPEGAPTHRRLLIVQRSSEQKAVLVQGCTEKPALNTPLHNPTRAAVQTRRENDHRVSTHLGDV
jgi:predicted acyl esterase